jgi:DNA-binding transcriptional LysR family regulator
MHDLDIATLRLFISVCDSKSISTVAKKVKMDSSAITRRIQKLEAEAGRPLLKRIRNGVEPTPEGLQFCDLCRELVRDAGRLSETLALYKTNGGGRVTIATTSSAVAGLLTEDLGQFLQLPDSNGLSVNIQEMTSSEVVQAVRDGRYSIGIYWDNVEASVLQTEPYYSDLFCCVVPVGHPLAQDSMVTYAQILEHPVIGMRNTRQGEAYLSRTGTIQTPKARFIAEAPTHEAAMRLVAARLGVFVTGLEIAKKYMGPWNLVGIPVSGLFAQQFRIAYRDLETLPLSAQRLIKHLSSAHPPLDAQI